MAVNLFVLLQWLNPVQPEDVKDRIKNIRHILNS